MYFTVKVQYYQQTSARRLQCFSRRIASLMVLKQLQKKSMKKEKIRIQHRTAYIKQAIDISLQAAVKTFQKAQHFLTFRKQNSKCLKIAFCRTFFNDEFVF